MYEIRDWVCEWFILYFFFFFIQHITSIIYYYYYRPPLLLRFGQKAFSLSRAARSCVIFFVRDTCCYYYYVTCRTTVLRHRTTRRVCTVNARGPVVVCVFHVVVRPGSAYTTAHPHRTYGPEPNVSIGSLSPPRNNNERNTKKPYRRFLRNLFNCRVSADEKCILTFSYVIFIPIHWYYALRQIVK